LARITTAAHPLLGAHLDAIAGGLRDGDAANDVLDCERAAITDPRRPDERTVVAATPILRIGGGAEHETERRRARDEPYVLHDRSLERKDAAFCQTPTSRRWFGSSPTRVAIPARHARSLSLEQCLLPFHTPFVAAECAVVPYDALTRDEHRDVIARACARDRPRRA